MQDFIILQEKKQHINPWAIIAVFSVLFAGISQPVTAQIADSGCANQEFIKNISVHESKGKIEFNAFDNTVLFGFMPDSFSAGNSVRVTRLEEPMPEPYQLDRISPVYQIEIMDKAAFTGKPYSLKVHYEENDRYKKLFYYDKNCACWRPIISSDNTWRNRVEVRLHFEFVRVAVFAYPDVPIVGRASWYAHKNGLFTASPDFPAGTRLRVLNINNNKFVDVTVNDYGPNRSVHPDRIVDLDKAAFKKIAAPSEGSVPVVVEVLAIPKTAVNLFGVADSGAATNVAVNAGAAVIYNETDGSIIWSKNAAASRPLASLTKLVAASVFMDTNPTLSTVVAYKTQDEKYNYEWCQPWESAKLSIAEGETLTIADLLYTSLVGSANNTIESMVRVSGLTRPDFIARMNKKASKWGASTTIFYEPTGLSPQNMSSAADYAIITAKVLANPVIQKASVMREYKFSTVNTKKPHTIRNTNKLAISNQYELTGSKTGYLDEAGYCLMTRVKKGDDSLIMVILGASDKANSYQDMLNLINYGFRSS